MHHPTRSIRYLCNKKAIHGLRVCEEITYLSFVCSVVFPHPRAAKAVDPSPAKRGEGNAPIFNVF